MTTRKDFVQALNDHAVAMRELRDSNNALMNSLHLFGEHLRTLAKETGDWRAEDNNNHSNEAGQRERMIELMEAIEKKLV